MSNTTATPSVGLSAHRGDVPQDHPTKEISMNSAEYAATNATPYHPLPNGARAYLVVKGIKHQVKKELFLDIEARGRLPEGWGLEVEPTLPSMYAQVEILQEWLRETYAEGGTIPYDDLDGMLDLLLAVDQSNRDDLMPEGTCRHGVYTGGCGVDWLCGPCEGGEE